MRRAQALFQDMFMKSKSAFLLIEWMVQCVILALLVIITTTVTIAWYKNIMRAHRLFAQTLPLYVATDVMCVDVHNAHRLSFEDNRLRLSYGDHVYGWYVAHEQLMRSSSAYDTKEHRWLKPTTALIASHIMSDKWTPVARQRALVGLSISLQNAHSSIESICAIRSGLIL